MDLKVFERRLRTEFKVIILLAIIGVVWWFWRKPTVDVCDSFWKYGPSSIRNVSKKGDFICEGSERAGFCVLEADEGFEMCLEMKECVGVLIEGNKGMLLAKPPVNAGTPTKALWFERKL